MRPKAAESVFVARKARAGMLGRRAALPPQEAAMADVVAPSSGSKTRPLMLVAGAVGVLFAASLALWAHYGTTVFFEMIRAGLALCF